MTDLAELAVLLDLEPADLTSTPEQREQDEADDIAWCMRNGWPAGVS